MDQRIELRDLTWDKDVMVEIIDYTNSPEFKNRLQEAAQKVHRECYLSIAYDTRPNRRVKGKHLRDAYKISKLKRKKVYMGGRVYKSQRIEVTPPNSNKYWPRAGVMAAGWRSRTKRRGPIINFKYSSGSAKADPFSAAIKKSQAELATWFTKAVVNNAERADKKGFR